MEAIPLHSLIFRCAAAVSLSVLLGAVAPTAGAQQTSDWAATASFGYGIAANVRYGTFGGVPVYLDVWKNNEAKGPVPTLIYIHGGGWVFGDKGGAPNLFLPYIERGWDVVNVEYRMAGTQVAPAAVEDVRCALRWVYQNAKQYGFDTTRLVASGHSAGGHLALMTGMLPSDSRFDRACPADAGDPPLRVAAIVNWYGITDVADLLQGANRRTYAVAWLGSAKDRDEVARDVSPLSYVRSDLPPIITIHGDHDPTVPYSHAQRLDAALQSAGVVHQLVTIPGGVHGSFSNDQAQRAFHEIWHFLEVNHITASKDAAKK